MVFGDTLDGVEDVLAIPYAASLETASVSIFAISQLATYGSGAPRIIEKPRVSAPSSYELIAHDTGNSNRAVLNYLVNGVAGTISGTRAITLAQPYLYATTVTTGSELLRINGTGEGSGSDTGAVDYGSTTDLFIGSSEDSSNALSGGIGELLLFDRALTLTEVGLVEQYLTNKFGPLGP